MASRYEPPTRLQTPITLEEFILHCGSLRRAHDELELRLLTHLTCGAVADSPEYRQLIVIAQPAIAKHRRRALLRSERLARRANRLRDRSDEAGRFADELDGLVIRPTD